MVAPTNATPSTPTVPDNPASPPVLPGESSDANTPITTGAPPTPVVALDPGTQNEPDTSYIYRAIEVTSIFSRGQFIQEIQGAQIFFDAPKTQVTENENRNTPEPGRPAQQADVRKVDNAIAERVAQEARDLLRLPNTNNTSSAPGVSTPSTVSFAKSNAPATSGNQVVGLLDTQLFNLPTASINVTLTNGTSRTVTSVEQINTLYAQGLIDFRTASGATVGLQSLIASRNVVARSSSNQVIATER
jgi:hypothetical protein